MDKHHPSTPYVKFLPTGHFLCQVCFAWNELFLDPMVLQLPQCYDDAFALTKLLDFSKISLLPRLLELNCRALLFSKISRWASACTKLLKFSKISRWAFFLNVLSFFRVSLRPSLIAYLVARRLVLQNIPKLSLKSGSPFVYISEHGRFGWTASFPTPPQATDQRVYSTS